MMDFTGTVEKVNKKSGINKNGKPYTLFSARVKGLEQWASFGFKDPGINEGDIVKLRGEVDGNNFKVSQHRVEGQDSSFTPQSNKPSNGFKNGFSGGQKSQSRDTYWADKEKHDREEREPRIQYQAARKDALEFLSVLAAQDALPITAAAGKGNKAKRFEELEEILDKLTVRFFHDTTSMRVLDRVQDSVIGDPAVAPLPTAEPVEEDQEPDTFGEDDEVPF